MFQNSDDNFSNCSSHISHCQSCHQLCSAESLASCASLHQSISSPRSIASSSSSTLSVLNHPSSSAPSSPTFSVATRSSISQSTNPTTSWTMTGSPNPSKKRSYSDAMHKDPVLDSGSPEMTDDVALPQSQDPTKPVDENIGGRAFMLDSTPTDSFGTVQSSSGGVNEPVNADEGPKPKALRRQDHGLDIDRFVQELGSGWRAIMPNDIDIPRYRATHSFIADHFPKKFKSIKLIARHDRFDYDLAETEQGVWLFTKNDNEGRLVSDNMIDAVTRLEQVPINFLGESWIKRVEGPSEGQASQDGFSDETQIPPEDEMDVS